MNANINIGGAVQDLGQRLRFCCQRASQGTSAGHVLQHVQVHLLVQRAGLEACWMELVEHVQVQLLVQRAGLEACWMELVEHQFE